jgi:hypothetical protein
MTTHFTVLSCLSSSSRMAQIIGDCTLSFPIGTWAVAANHFRDAFGGASKPGQAY